LRRPECVFLAGSSIHHIAIDGIITLLHYYVIMR